jgi:hypothetical protein
MENQEDSDADLRGCTRMCADKGVEAQGGLQAIHCRKKSGELKSSVREKNLTRIGAHKE